MCSYFSRPSRAASYASRSRLEFDQGRGARESTRNCRQSSSGLNISALLGRNKSCGQGSPLAALVCERRHSCLQAAWRWLISAIPARRQSCRAVTGMKKRKSVAIWIAVLFVLSLAVYPALGFSPRLDGSYEEVQELFNARCVLCHSCNNAPCQLKLSSYGGLQRGASKIEAIHPKRLQIRLMRTLLLRSPWRKASGRSS